MKKYLKNFLRYKYLLTELVKKNIKLKYRRSYLGILWTLIEPLLTMLVLTLVFGTFFGNNDEQYPVYILSGRLLYSFFSSGTKSGLRAVSGNAAMIKKVYVPKYIYVLSTVISNFVSRSGCRSSCTAYHLCSSGNCTAVYLTDHDNGYQYDLSDLKCIFP